ncbi:sensor histidine kinase [Streptomyces sp. NPDC088789]|uniref:sensor histidine kinase n=1 Tax=Streptomyces sp. NPDC088789 TaxID=3365899 RepID=UPI0038303372
MNREHGIGDALRRAGRWYLRHARERGLVSPALSWLRNDVLILFVTVLELVDYLGTAASSPWDATPVGVVLLVLTSALLLPRHSHPVRTLVALVAAQTAVGLIVPMGQGVSVPMLLAFYGVARTADRPTVIWAGVLTVGATAVRSLVAGVEFAAVAGDTLGPVLVGAIAVWVRQWRRQTALTRRLLEERAVTDERRRIARELHDVVAHHITTMYLMSGGARTMLDHDPAATREALVTLETSARSALGEMRALLGVLRSDDAPDAPSEPQPGVADIERLIESSKAAGVPAELHITGEPPAEAVPATTGLTLYRVVQEALTNARKHARGAHAVVRLDYGPGRVTVTVTDDGRPRPHGLAGRRTASSLAGGGYGLLGMRERVAVHGGSLEAGPREEGGFRVTATVPLPPS